MGVFPGTGVREDVYARTIWLARPPSSDVGADPITFTYGRMVGLFLSILRAVGGEK